MGLKCLEGEDKMEDVMNLPCTKLGNFCNMLFVFVLSQHFLFQVNWDAIKDEISYSNVIQRDNLLFARKLDKNLVPIAKEGDKNVGIGI